MFTKKKKKHYSTQPENYQWSPLRESELSPTTHKREFPTLVLRKPEQGTYTHTPKGSKRAKYSLPLWKQGRRKPAKDSRKLSSKFWGQILEPRTPAAYKLSTGFEKADIFQTWKNSNAPFLQVHCCDCLL